MSNIRGKILAACLLLQLMMLPLYAEDFAKKYDTHYNRLSPPLPDVLTPQNNQAILPIEHRLLSTGEIEGIFSNNGVYGTGFISNPLCNGLPCPSFETPENSDLDYLFGGALWIGGIVNNDTLVSIALDGWYGGITEFFPRDTAMYFDNSSDDAIWTMFNDTITDVDLTGMDPYDNRPHLPLNIRVANRAHTWLADPYNNAIIYDMVITNIGDTQIDDGYVGLYFDADVYHLSKGYPAYIDDLTGSIRDAGIAYVIDNDGDPTIGGEFDFTSPTKLFALRYLHTSFAAYDTSYNWWINNGNAALDFGPQPLDGSACIFGAHTGTPTGDASKYCIMSNADWDYDQIRSADSVPGWTYPPNMSLAYDFADGYDARFLLSIGPFDLLPDSSVRLFYTTFTGDSVHNDPLNFQNYFDPDTPDVFLANLDFSDVLENSDWADILVDMLMNPETPVIGLHVQYNSLDSVVIEWDPWVFDDVEGYEVYLYTIPPDSLPYPGVAPPWIKPISMQPVAGLDRTYRHMFDTLSPYCIYLAAAAHRTAVTTGDICDPVLVQPGGRPPGPIVTNPSIFIQSGQAALLDWDEPSGVNVDYYNIYKFDDWEAAQDKYYPRYDRGEFGQIVAARDSFHIDSDWYYYYAMEPFDQRDSGITSFAEYADDSAVYIVTAVNRVGLESAFSGEVTVFEIPERTKDILVLTCKLTNTDFVECDTMTNFYDSILQGYDYDIYVYKDTINAYGNDCKWQWWYDFMHYKLVIVDAGLRYDILNTEEIQCMTLSAVEKYLWSGGQMAYFGSFPSLTEYSLSATPPGYYPIEEESIHDFFGIDSVFQMALFHYQSNSTEPYVDSLIGFSRAGATEDTIPDIAFDLLRYPFKSMISAIWPTNTAPIVSTFSVLPGAQVIHRLNSLYPSTSLVENHSVGVKTHFQDATAYIFGFHLWYMDPSESRDLIDYMMGSDAQICGDANGDGAVNIGDPVHVINYVFRSGPYPEPLCTADANGDGSINIGDAVYLISYIFRSGPPLVEPCCPR